MPPQIDGDLNAQLLLLLFFAQLLLVVDIEQQRGEELRQRRAVPFCGLVQLRDGHHADRVVAKVTALFDPGRVVHVFVAAVVFRFGIRILPVGVALFLRGRRLTQIEHRAAMTDLCAAKAQILRDEGGNENGVGVTVAERVEKVDGDALIVVIDTEEEAAVFFEVDPVADVLDVGLDVRFVGVLFKVVPEQSVLQTHVEGREPVEHLIERRFQQHGIDFFMQLNADAENVRPGARILPRKDLCRVVKLIPVLSCVFHCNSTLILHI